ncbi:HlyD family secretion protein [Bosea sp. AS-1]|uniref:HlyD family secretion protein n=1 Tax=Bosea sp. AS-1 TaxID=2015316 RepID=UPI0024A6BF42|nr:HlyD family secretion protein [Bosea sp. AS-1]
MVLGQQAHIKLHAFNQRSTPELNGTVSRISADTARDQQTGSTYYTIRVTVASNEFGRLALHRVTAGMLADVFVQTADRTPFQYLIKPLTDQIGKTFRER